ncbi:MlaC/ttg2D family ABC transporter substrate-binding protein [sulfur-oxidizing endosymbiont of Gigantopelta aegis]|uniref:MlaC/ttg2D family ABC transporter substrate-binding protein n=1 Tax=sulfur-oxidizing endosymbiont of Gigantopelta aegis TaxID=2794934 RepID=UPI0018DDDA61|nr:ABC transporter substrate-binding protein [sulfur-oxidizing endosymbiont of Gigantopelta aegis]
MLTLHLKLEADNLGKNMFSLSTLTNLSPIGRILIQSFLLAIVLSSISYADVPVPQKLMEDTSKHMINEFRNNTDAIRNDPQIALQLVNHNLVPKINFPLMSRWVLGKNWRKATPEQQKKFIVEFQTLVVKFYSKALIQFLSSNDLSDDIITFKPFRGELKGKYATIRSQVNPPSGAEPVKVNYDLYHSKNGEWKVYDVSVEGISLVTTYRSSFKQIISKKGMDALLMELASKNSSSNKANEPQIAEKS